MKRICVVTQPPPTIPIARILPPPTHPVPYLPVSLPPPTMPPTGESKDVYVLRDTFLLFTCDFSASQRFKLRQISKKFKELVEKDPYWETYIDRKNWIPQGDLLGTHPCPYFHMALLYKLSLKVNILKGTHLKMTLLGENIKSVHICKRYMLLQSSEEYSLMPIHCGLLKPCLRGISIPSEGMVLGVCPDLVVYSMGKCVFGIPIASHGIPVLLLDDEEEFIFREMEYNEHYIFIRGTIQRKLYVILIKTLQLVKMFDNVLKYSLTPSKMYMLRDQMPFVSWVSLYDNKWAARCIDLMESIKDGKMEGNILCSSYLNDTKFWDLDRITLIARSDFVETFSRHNNKIIIILRGCILVYDIKKGVAIHSISNIHNWKQLYSVQTMYYKDQLIYLFKDGSCQFVNLREHIVVDTERTNSRTFYHLVKQYRYANSGEEERPPPMMFKTNPNMYCWMEDHDYSLKTIPLFTSRDLSFAHVLDCSVIFQNGRNICSIEVDNQLKKLSEVSDFSSPISVLTFKNNMKNNEEMPLFLKNLLYLQDSLKVHPFWRWLKSNLFGNLKKNDEYSNDLCQMLRIAQTKSDPLKSLIYLSVRVAIEQLLLQFSKNWEERNHSSITKNLEHTLEACVVLFKWGQSLSSLNLEKLKQYYMDDSITNFKRKTEIDFANIQQLLTFYTEELMVHWEDNRKEMDSKYLSTQISNQNLFKEFLGQSLDRNKMWSRATIRLEQLKVTPLPLMEIRDRIVKNLKMKLKELNGIVVQKCILSHKNAFQEDLSIISKFLEEKQNGQLTVKDYFTLFYEMNEARSRILEVMIQIKGLATPNEELRRILDFLSLPADSFM